MPSEFVVAGMIAVITLALTFAHFVGRRRGEPVAFENEREERLTNQLAGLLGCSLAQALPALRRELRLAPSQSDETILKRAEYHYRRNVPDAPCPVWRGGRPSG
jgi:hypothetical protein